MGNKHATSKQPGDHRAESATPAAGTPEAASDPSYASYAHRAPAVAERDPIVPVPLPLPPSRHVPPARRSSAAASSSSSSSATAAPPALPSYSSARSHARQLELVQQAAAPPPAGPPVLQRQVSFADDDLHYACRTGNLDRVKYCLSRKPGLLQAWDMYGNIPLYYACLCGQTKTIQYLMEQGAWDSDNDRCWFNAYSIEIRKMLRDHEKARPELYSGERGIKLQADEPATEMPAELADPMSYPSLLRSLRDRLDTQQPELFLTELQDICSMLESLAPSTESGKSPKRTMAFKTAAGSAELPKTASSSASSSSSTSAAATSSASSPSFLSFLYRHLRLFLEYPAILQTGLRLLALLCSNHPANLKQLLLSWNAVSFLDHVLGEVTSNKNPGGLRGPTAQVAPASSVLGLSTDPASSMLHFMSSLEILTRDLGNVVLKAPDLKSAFQPLLPVLLGALKSYLDFPPLVAAVLRVLSRLITLDMELQYRFLVFQGVEMCVAAYLAYSKPKGPAADAEGDEEEEEAAVEESAALMSPDVRGLDEENEESKSPSSPVRSPGTSAPQVTVRSLLAASIPDPSSPPAERVSTAQIPRLAMRLLQQWVGLPRADDDELLLHMAPAPGAQPASAQSYLQEAYAFLRLESMTPNPLIDVGVAYTAFFNSPSLADCVFVFENEENEGGLEENEATAPIWAHKLVLAARCEYFKVMFCSAGRFAESSLAVPPMLSGISSRQVRASTLGAASVTAGVDPSRSLLELRVPHSRSTVLRFVEYLYVGLSAGSLQQMARLSVRNAELMEAWEKQQAMDAKAAAADAAAVIDVQPSGSASANSSSVDAKAKAKSKSVALSTPPLPLHLSLSNVHDYLDLLRISDEYQCVQLRVFVEYLLYSNQGKTRLLNPDTLWLILTSSILFHAPMLEFHCIKYMVARHAAEEESMLLSASGFKKHRKQVLQSYGFLA